MTGTAFADLPHQSVSVPGGHIQYRRTSPRSAEGSSPPLLFLHGVFVNGNVWRGVVDRLADTFDCVVPDLPFGSHEVPMDATADLTPLGVADVISNLIQALDLAPVRLVANDSGGAFAQILTAQQPDLIDSLVLTNCDCYGNFFPLIFRYLTPLSRVRGGLFPVAHALRFRAVRRSPLAYGWSTARPLPRDVERAYVAPLRHSDIRRDIAKVMRDVHPRYTRAAIVTLRSFERPVLIVWGDADKYFPIRLGRQLASDIPNARFVAIPGARAFLPEDAPHELADAIREFYA
ncbi:alpha/beta hydrolase [Hoyosella sp. YIM 151337]|uniref:alpha/beta fold hydrolase n=1 Tax=Hoyosella sp. YIM 151337 TaxID=2992742 RepID=UPI0022362BC9|nr:alpha/beta hydrolase [Hoyosella sp. YIM 151337]MCW4353000.1 alpha/beta hydrolase [Hoyosella sp. YIM 151337]